MASEKDLAKVFAARHSVTASTGTTTWSPLPPVVLTKLSSPIARSRPRTSRPAGGAAPAPPPARDADMEPLAARGLDETLQPDRAEPLPNFERGGDHVAEAQPLIGIE